eukprot:590290-Rhodomonas_salina.3
MTLTAARHARMGPTRQPWDPMRARAALLACIRRQGEPMLPPVSHALWPRICSSTAGWPRASAVLQDLLCAPAAAQQINKA